MTSYYHNTTLSGNSDLNIRNINNWAYGFFIGVLINASRTCLAIMSNAFWAASVTSERYDLCQVQSQRVRIDLMNFLDRSCFWQGYSFSNSRRVGVGWGVNRRLWFIAHVIVPVDLMSSTRTERLPSMPGDGIIVTIYRWRFAPPIITDDAMKCGADNAMDGNMICDPVNTVVVFRYNMRSLYYIQTVAEVAMPQSCPTLPFSCMLADKMVALYKASMYLPECKDRLAVERRRGGFVLAGTPGCGKSVAARVFAFKLDAVLAYFDPSQCDGIDQYIDALATSRKSMMALVIEEVDTDLEHMLLAKQKSDKDIASYEKNKYSPWSVNDKKSWCALFDRLQFYPNIIPVATTNKSLSWLQEFDREHFEGALFRVGRFGNLIDCDALAVNFNEEKTKRE